MDPNQSNFSDLRDEIVAYLDGELSPEKTAEVERRLVEDDGYRQEMLELQRTWELIGQIPQSAASGGFKASTIELVIQGDLGEKTPSRNAFQWRWMVLLLAGFIAIGAGYFLSVERIEAPQRAIARDMEMLTDWQTLASIDSVEFLNELDQSGLAKSFGEFAKDRLSGELINDEQSKQNTTLASLSLERQSHLFQLKKEFDRLTIEKRNQIRELDRSLDRESRESLIETQKQFNRWLQSLTAKYRDQIINAEPESRLESVIAIHKIRLSLGLESNLPNLDRKSIQVWERGFLTSKKEQIFKYVESLGALTFSPDQEIQILRSAVVGKLTEVELMEIVDRDSIEVLKSKLSGTASEVLKISEDLRCTHLLIRNWLSQANKELEIDPKVLIEFYDQELTIEQQLELDQMTPRNRRVALESGYKAFLRAELSTDWRPSSVLRKQAKINRILQAFQDRS